MYRLLQRHSYILQFAPFHSSNFNELSTGWGGVEEITNSLRVKSFSMKTSLRIRY